MDLENEPHPEPPAQPAQEAPPAEPPADPDEAAALEVQGGKYVPLDALKTVRSENKELKTRAAEADQLRQTVAQLQGSLATFQQLQQQQPRPPETPTSGSPDPRLEKLARSLDYYKPDGTPDLHRAAVHAELIREQATEIAQQWVQPLQQNAAQQQSAANYQQALRTAAPNGMKPKAETLTWMWRNLPPEYTADPRVAQVLPALALGLDTLQGGSPLPAQPAPPGNPPVMTEAVGGNQPRQRTTLSETERAVLAGRGISDETYGKLTKDFKQGRTSALED
jgi:hypothetical protein